MSFKLTEWFLILNALSALYVLSLDISLGIAYGFAATCVSIPVYLGARIKKPEFQVCFILIGLLIWITHLLRPLVLIPNPELFTYSAVLGIASKEVMRVALVKVGLCSIGLLAGLYAGLSLVKPTAKKRKRNKAFKLAQSSQYFRRTERGFLLKNKGKVTIIILILLALDAFSKLILKVGLKTQFSQGPSSINAILLILVPQFLIYAFISILLLKYKQRTKPILAALTGFFLLDLISGSKGAFAEVVMIIFSVYIFLEGNTTIKGSKILLSLAGSALAMFLTFSVANAIRFSSSSYDSQIFSLISESVAYALNPEALLELANSVTGRFIGFDGLIATEMYRPAFIVEIFDFLNTVSRIISKVNPLDGGGGSITSGKALGLVYFALDEDFAFAGAVGVFGALQLMAGSTYLYIASVGAGLFYSSLFTIGERFKSSDFSISFFCLVILMITRSIMSGNFDLSLSSFVINIFSLIFYWALISIL